MNQAMKKKIAEIREALEKAAPGPWKWVDVYKRNDFEKYSMGGFVNEEGKLICHFGNRIDYYPTEGEPPDYYDELLIANATEWLGFLLSELERLEREYAEERAAHNAHVTELCELEQETRKLREERDAYYNNARYTEAAFHEVTSLRSQLQSAQQEIERLQQERDKLIECLRFYERMARGREANDGGRRARTLLAEIGVAVMQHEPR